MPASCPQGGGVSALQRDPSPLLSQDLPAVTTRSLGARRASSPSHRAGSPTSGLRAPDLGAEGFWRAAGSARGAWGPRLSQWRSRAVREQPTPSGSAGPANLLSPLQRGSDTLSAGRTRTNTADPLRSRTLSPAPLGDSTDVTTARHARASSTSRGAAPPVDSHSGRGPHDPRPGALGRETGASRRLEPEPPRADAEPHPSPHAGSLAVHSPLSARLSQPAAGLRGSRTGPSRPARTLPRAGNLPPVLLPHRPLLTAHPAPRSTRPRVTLSASASQQPGRGLLSVLMPCGLQLGCQTRAGRARQRQDLVGGGRRRAAQWPFSQQHQGGGARAGAEGPPALVAARGR